MKKGDFINKATEYGKRVVKATATYYANVTCPLVVYQPKMRESVKKLRRF